MDAACSPPRRNRCADESVFRLSDALAPPSSSCTYAPYRATLVLTAICPTIEACAPATYPRPYRIRHWPDVAYPPQRERDRGLAVPEPWTRASSSTPSRTLPARAVSPQPSWPCVCFPRPSPPHRCIPIAHRTPRSLRAGATAIRPPGRPGLAHIPQSRLESDGVQPFALLWSCVPDVSPTNNWNRRVVTCYTPSNSLRSASDWSQGSLSAFLYRLSRNAHMTPPGPRAIQVLRGDRIQLGIHLWLVVK